MRDRGSGCPDKGIKVGRHLADICICTDPFKAVQLDLKERNMPITAHPVDGLISRLLQQYHRSSEGGSASHASAHAKPDSVNISDTARNMTGADAGRLESSLLDLYSQRGNA